MFEKTIHVIPLRGQDWHHRDPGVRPDRAWSASRPRVAGRHQGDVGGDGQAAEQGPEAAHQAAVVCVGGRDERAVAEWRTAPCVRPGRITVRFSAVQ